MCYLDTLTRGEYMSQIYKGHCFCGVVHVEISGSPVAMSYCHCQSCRSWSGSPVHASTLWSSDSVEVTTGVQHIHTFHKSPQSISHRQYCAQCGGHLMISHPTLGIFDVCAATIPTLKFTPSLHVNYAETVLPMRDGLPKFRDFPREFGGSGELMVE